MFCSFLCFSAYTHLLAEELDKTLEAPGERMSPKGTTDVDSCKKEVCRFPPPPLFNDILNILKITWTVL